MACLNEPRAIELHVCGTSEDWQFYCKGGKPPSVLHATIEPRLEALKWYKLKATPINKWFVHSIPPRRQYFNFHIDILSPTIFNISWGLMFLDSITMFETSWAEVVTKY